MDEWPFGGKRFVEAHGLSMAAIDTAPERDGLTFMMLHGNPTSSYLWRSVIPHLAPLGRCVAPDLLGMGDSAKLPDSGPDSYTVDQQISYLDAALEALDIGDRVVVVLHDWGAVPGLSWARRHAGRLAGLAYMEAMTHPLSWDGLGPFTQGVRAWRTPLGEEQVLGRNALLEQVLPMLTVRDLTAEEIDECRRPFVHAGEDRRVTLSWNRQIPVDGDPPDVHQIMTDNVEWAAGAEVPKLLIVADPRFITLHTPDVLAACRTWPRQSEVTVPGTHYIQHDSPDLIGRAIADWAATLPGDGK